MMRRIGVLFLLGALVLAACDEAISLRGDGDVVTETRTVSEFDKVDANNGVRVFLTVDPAAAGDVVLEVTTDSNLQDYLTTRESGGKLTVTSSRIGGVTPTGEFRVSGTVASLTDVKVNNGARVEITGSVDEVTLSANNGSHLDGDAFQTTTAEVEADNGAQITVCVTGEVSGEVTNGADLTVLCGGSMRVDTSGGGRVSSSP